MQLPPFLQGFVNNRNKYLPFCLASLRVHCIHSERGWVATVGIEPTTQHLARVVLCCVDALLVDQPSVRSLAPHLDQGGQQVPAHQLLVRLGHVGPAHEHPVPVEEVLVRPPTGWKQNNNNDQQQQQQKQHKYVFYAPPSSSILICTHFILYLFHICFVLYIALLLPILFMPIRLHFSFLLLILP